MYGFVEPKNTLEDIRIGKCIREINKVESIREKNTSFFADLKTFFDFF
jgi:hypothetical protein